jgi:myo-inositol-1(or 4)-monophosphatase
LLSILKTILPSVLRAGEEVLKIYNTSFSVSFKEKDDPLTQADLLSHEIISLSIHTHFPDHFLLSEEEKEAPSRKTHSHLWLLDPIDGTREFVKKNNQFAISLGLAISGKIELGIVFNPSTDELFLGIPEKGLLSTSSKNLLWEPWEHPLESQSSHPKPICIVSHTEFKEGLYSHPFWQETYEIKSIGSIAYKLGLLSTGKADLCISLKPKSDWDIGGGIALVEGAGGVCLSLLDSKPFDFQRDSIRKEGILAGRKELIQDLLTHQRELLNSLYRSTY